MELGYSKLSGLFSLKETASEEGRFTGYASVFDIEDRDGDIVERGAFKACLETRQARDIKLLWQHNIDEPIGVLEDIKEDERGLYVAGRLLVDSDATAKRCYAHLVAGSIDALSIGYQVSKSRRSDHHKRILEEVVLWEVSFVTFPANPRAFVSAVKSPDDLAQLLVRSGFTEADARAVVAKGYEGLSSAALSSPSHEGHSEFDKLFNNLRALTDTIKSV